MMILTSEFLDNLHLEEYTQPGYGTTRAKKVWSLDKYTVIAEIKNPFEDEKPFEIRFLDSKENRFIPVRTIKELDDFVKSCDIDGLPPIMGRHRCHDCGVYEGEFHRPGCDMERCPYCGGQLISCGCCYEKLGIRDYDRYPGTYGLPPDIYNNGLSEDLSGRWEQILREKGRVPYILYPNICGRCGQVWPEMFSVPNEEWQKYIQKDARNLILCPSCYKFIKSLIDTYANEVR